VWTLTAGRVGVVTDTAIGGSRREWGGVLGRVPIT
jgi:hypothetical protein